MEFLLEIVIELFLQLGFEIAIGLLGHLLDTILGRDPNAAVAFVISSVFYAALGIVGGWVSVLLISAPLGGGSPQPWIYFAALPALVTPLLYLVFRKSDRMGKVAESTATSIWYCCCVSWAFSITRYVLFPAAGSVF